MSIPRFLVPLLLLPVLAGAQQTDPPEGARITAATVSGFDVQQLSAALQRDIGALVGAGLNRQWLNELAARLEAEQPDCVAAVRATADPDGGARVVFVVARIRDEVRAANINSRYVVEDARVRGVAERDLDRALRDDVRALVGRPLDVLEAERLEALLQDEFPDYDISRRTIRGSRPGRVRLIFDVRRVERRPRWLRFEPQEANLVYHSDQGWGARLPLSISGGDLLFTPFFAFDVGDDLIEEYGGLGLRVETRSLGTERLGAFFEWSSFDQTWRDVTLSALAADPRVPAAYRSRTTVTPVLRFAVTRSLSLAGGVRVTELDPLSDTGESRMANAALGSVSFSSRSRDASGSRHDVEAAFVVRAGTSALEGDLAYERYVGHVGYAFRTANHTALVSGTTGRIDGPAPLFERFSLGDSRTLRGWNKYDIAPIGGSRMFHASIEYRYRHLGLFVDAGSVWDDGAARRVRVSTGLTATPGPVFLTVGFPLNTSEYGAVFAMGLRFSGSPVGISKY